MFDSDRTTVSLLARRALAEKATPGPWVRKGEYLVYGPWGDRPVSGKEGILNPADAAHIAANDPPTVIADIDEILRLRAEVEFWRQETQDVRENFERTLQCERDKTDRLEREADWLAEQLSYSCSFTGEHNCGIPKPCPKTYGCGCLDVEAEEWREAARKAVEENHEN